jgi:hypothetical protein
MLIATIQFAKVGVQCSSCFMKSPLACCITLLLFASFQGLSARAEEKRSSVSSEELNLFMKKWAKYESFKVPMEPADEPLLLAALKKDPAGPWGSYLTMKFANTVGAGRQVPTAERPAHYKKSLAFLQPAATSSPRRTRAIRAIKKSRSTLMRLTDN